MRIWFEITQRRLFVGIGRLFLLCGVLFVVNAPANAVIVRDASGLSLTFAQNGRISDLTAGGRSLLDTSEFSGFEITDKISGKTENLTGTLHQVGSLTVFSANSTSLGLTLTARIKPASDHLLLYVAIDDLSHQDRAIDASLVLRLKNAGWIWCNDLNSSYPAQAGVWNICRGTYAQHTQSAFPFGAITTPEGTGLSLGWPMTSPRFYTQSFTLTNDGVGEFRISVPLGLSSDTKKFPNFADFNILLSSFDGSQKFRGALAQYYKMCPDSFERRTKQPGTWTLWLQDGTLDYAKKFGVLYDEAEYDLGGIPSVLRDNKNGFRSFQYSEPWGFWYPIPPGWKDAQPKSDLPSVSPYETILPKKALYDKVAADLGSTKTSDRYPGATRGTVAQAIMNTAVGRDPAGNWLTTIYLPKGFVWGDDRKGWDNITIIANPDPNLPHPNRADIAWDDQYMYVANKARALGAHLDGAYVDSFVFSMGMDNFDFRRDHWAYADFPLTYSTLPDGKIVPAESLALADVDYLKDLKKRTAKYHWPILVNGWYPLYAISAAYIDIIGAGEAGADEARVLVPQWDMGYFRALADQKPVTIMDYALTLYLLPGTQESVDKIVEPRLNHYLLYGIYPGTANGWAADNSANLKLVLPVMEKYFGLIRTNNLAGWQPVSYATSDTDNIIVERWGKEIDKGLYFTLYNDSDQVRTVHVTVDLAALKCGKPGVGRELVSGHDVSLDLTPSTAGFTLTLQPKRTSEVQFLGNAGATGGL